MENLHRGVTNGRTGEDAPASDALARAAAAIVLLCAFALTVGAQRPEPLPAPLPAGPQQAVLSGRVVADDTGAPIPNARIGLAGAESAASLVVLADNQGGFSLAPATGSARLIVSIHADWTFEIGGVNGPRRLQVLRAPEGWA